MVVVGVVLMVMVVVDERQEGWIEMGEGGGVGRGGGTWCW